MILVANFGIIAVLGVMLVLLDFMAMANDPTPSMYNSGVTEVGLTMMAIGLLGALVSFIATAT